MKRQTILIIGLILFVVCVYLYRSNTNPVFYFANTKKDDPKPKSKSSSSSTTKSKASSSSNLEKRDKPVFYAKSYKEVGKALETLVKNNVDQKYVNAKVAQLNKTVKNGKDFFKAVNADPVLKAMVKAGYVDSIANHYKNTNVNDAKDQGQNYLFTRTTPKLSMTSSQYPNGEQLNLKPVNDLNPQLWPQANYKPDLVVTSIGN